MDISDITARIKDQAPLGSTSKLEYYEAIRDWLDDSISSIRTDLVRTERPHETMARIGREIRNAKERRG